MLASVSRYRTNHLSYGIYFGGSLQVQYKIQLILVFFLTASHLGTVVASVQVLLHTPHARTHPTHYEYSNKPTTTLRLEDRVLEEITGTIHGAVDDGHVVLPLWLHA